MLILMGYSNYYPNPPVEETWNFQGKGALTLEFPGERCINFQLNFQGRGTLTKELPGEGVD
jgi:hypothetical protein